MPRGKPEYGRKDASPTSVHVPKVPPGLTGMCWQQEPGKGGMGVRCDRAVKHRGLHSWELHEVVETLEERVRGLESRVHGLERMFAVKG